MYTKRHPSQPGVFSHATLFYGTTPSRCSLISCSMKVGKTGQSDYRSSILSRRCITLTTSCFIPIDLLGLLPCIPGYIINQYRATLQWRGVLLDMCILIPNSGECQVRSEHELALISAWGRSELARPTSGGLDVVRDIFYNVSGLILGRVEGLPTPPFG